ncbi:MAG: ribosome biogenesis GTP-binding protein YihA/YsxC [Bacteroidales bacterium]|nr:ribosome biogenesis GTP-binding protein YihA/YsxC [Bacteroidales bacterium]MCF8387634.1 ribosome biogenesis GTP-binding protein YihA/YsxC [Bacteroidales bacterium]MCF8397942.1 ribosome biogenesis GTP-binding protein YihA/YsxC [Bacteroidales bacterium]
MEITQAEYIGSCVDVKKCPFGNKPEYAFIGRSNVGKSSLINMITGRKKLAKTSGTPGKTTLINHFLINDSWYLVDLPGYGFAKRSKTEREKWGKMIQEYLLKRKNLLCTFILIDARLPMQDSDQDLMEWMGVTQLPFTLVFTKSDKLNRNEFTRNMEAYKNELHKSWAELPQMFFTSAKNAMGKTEILDFIERTNTLLKS